MVRCFLAINLSSETNSIIRDALSEWRSIRIGVKWVKPRNIHLTLKFLGEIRQEQVQDISKVAHNVCFQTKSFCLRTGDTGVFPNLNRPRVLWLGLTGDVKSLQVFKASIEQEFSYLGFEREDRPFVPHITVGRIKGTPPSKKQLSTFLKSHIKKTVTKVDRLYIFKSVLTSSGPVYSILSSCPFGEKTST